MTRRTSLAGGLAVALVAIVSLGATGSSVRQGRGPGAECAQRAVGRVELTPELVQMNTSGRAPLSAVAYTTCSVRLTGQTFQWTRTDSTHLAVTVATNTATATVIATADTSTSYVFATTAGKKDSTRVEVRAVPTAPPAVPTCLSGGGPLITLTGAQSATVQAYVPNQRVDASAATWIGAASYPVNVGANASPGLCWHGGLIDGNYATSTSWATWHTYVSVFNHSPNAIFEQLRIRSAGDGFRMGDSASSWTVRDLVIEDAHDDCVENDRLEAGVIERVWMSCYTFLSEQPGNKYPGQNGAGKVVAIRNSVIYEKPMPTTNNPPAPGTSFLFKWFTQNLAAGAKMTAVTAASTVFRLDQPPSTSSGKSDFPLEFNCADDNVWMVWRGTGAYPGRLPACVHLTTSVAKYDSAAAAWQTAHPGL